MYLDIGAGLKDGIFADHDGGVEVCKERREKRGEVRGVRARECRGEESQG